MSWQTRRTGTPASVAAFRARSSSVSLKSTPVTGKPRRANSTEWRPKPQGASRTRAPASSAAAPTIHSTSLAASVGEAWPQISQAVAPPTDAASAPLGDLGPRLAKEPLALEHGEPLYRGPCARRQRCVARDRRGAAPLYRDRKSTRLNSSHC